MLILLIKKSKQKKKKKREVAWLLTVDVCDQEYKKKGL